VEYYKLEGTGNNYIDNYGYISFEVADPIRPTVVQPLAETIVFANDEIDQFPFQGMTISKLAVFFLRPAVDRSTTTINLGYVVMRLTDSTLSGPSSEITSRRMASLVLNLAPIPSTTCSLDNLNVILPTVGTSALKNTNDEAGHTDFTVSIRCGTTYGYPALSAELVDNNMISNQGDILSNMGSAENVGVRVYNPETTQAINFYEKFNIGQVESNSVVTKRFYAKYAATGKGPVTAGTVHSTATLNLDYQ